MDTGLRELRHSDRAAWEPLWAAYQEFYRVDLGQAVTFATWQRILDANEPVHGLGLFDGNRLLGIAHFLLHRSTWSTADTCYLQDLYIVPEARGQGLARRMVEAVYATAQARGCGQVYWLTHESNATARRLYDRLATNAGFIVYEHAVSDGSKPAADLAKD